MRVSQSGPTQPLQPMQRPAAQAKPAEAAPAQQKPQAAPTPKDENKAKSFNDTPLKDVSTRFAEAGKIAGGNEEMAALLAAEEAEEAEESSEADEAEALAESAELAETEEAEEAKEAEEAESESEEEQGENEDGEAGKSDLTEDREADGRSGGAQINIAALLTLLPELRAAPRFRIEETWPLFAAR